MKKHLLILTIVTAMYDSSAQTLDAEQIYKKVNNAVVTIYAYDSQQKILSLGSGIVLNGNARSLHSANSFTGNKL